MSRPDFLTPWTGRTPGLTLGDCLHRSGFCADCINDGKPCPDHRQDPAAETEAGS